MVMMRQLIGPYAGELVDMPFAVAENCRAAGTAARPDESPSVKGLKFTPEPESKRIEKMQHPDDFEVRKNYQDTEPAPAPAPEPTSFPQMIKKGFHRLSDGSVFKGNKKFAAKAQAALDDAAAAAAEIGGDDTPTDDLS